MIDLANLVLGPLAIPECRRAARRPWPIVARTAAGAIASILAFVTIWTWWITSQVDPTHQPFRELRICLSALVGMAVAIALVLAPAFLAGALAGEKERGSIGLLLATDASALDIVLGRLAGGLGLVALIELSTIPLLVGIASLAGFDAARQATLASLPMAVAFGAGGIALAASAMSRRGRDALMLVYLLMAATQLAPWLGRAGFTNPFSVLGPVAWGDEMGPAGLCSLAWVAAGLIGLSLATWRLRPAALSEGKGDRDRRRARRRGRRVPEVDAARPMLWKERYIERAGTLGGIGRWIGGAIVAWLLASSLILGGIVAHEAITAIPDPARSQWAVDLLELGVSGPAGVIAVLIWAAIGLRAAVTIASERERGTWDGLLTSPLEGREILSGKLAGSLRAVRWLLVSAVLAWTIATGAGAMSLRTYLDSVLSLAAVGLFMAALGVRVSLQSATATRAMGLTLAQALLAAALIAIAAASICLAVALACWLGWLFLGQIGQIDLAQVPIWFPMSFSTGYLISRITLYVVAAMALVAETRLRFDRVAGRMTAGKASVAVDRFIHGGPVLPVRMGSSPASMPADSPLHR